MGNSSPKVVKRVFKLYLVEVPTNTEWKSERLEVTKLLPIIKFRSKIGVRKENRRYRDSLGLDGQTSKNT